MIRFRHVFPSRAGVPRTGWIAGRPLRGWRSICLGLMLLLSSNGAVRGENEAAANPAGNPSATVTRESPPTARSGLIDFVASESRQWITSERNASSLRLVVTMLALGLIPALLLMTTAYVRIAIVLGLLRQAFGAPQVLPAQVTTSLALISTVLIMWPTWQSVYDEAVVAPAEIADGGHLGADAGTPACSRSANS